MGYTTEFKGRLKFSTPLTAAQTAYIRKFNLTRRVKRYADRAEAMPDPERAAVGYNVGPEGCYFVGGDCGRGPDQDHSVFDYNKPPVGQPGLWCQWTVTRDGTQLGWDGGEKFYDYVAWLKYLIDHFFTPWKTSLNGKIRWQGEDPSDTGTIVVKDSVVTVN